MTNTGSYIKTSDVTKKLLPRPRLRYQMKIILFTWSGNRYQRSGTVDLFSLLPVEYDPSVDAAHSVAIHLFGPTSTIHSTSIRKRLPQTLSWSVTTVVDFIWERFTTLDILGRTKTLKMRLKTVSRPRHVSRLPIPDKYVLILYFGDYIFAWQSKLDFIKRGKLTD